MTYRDTELPRDPEPVGFCPGCGKPVAADDVRLHGFAGAWHDECVNKRLDDSGFALAVQYAEDVDPSGFFRWLRANREFAEDLIADYRDEHRAAIKTWLIW